MDKNCFGYIKFTDKKWAKKLVDGELSFSCAGKYISDEQTTGDISRGDRLEAVFAHIKKGDSRVGMCKKRFGADLEIIEDNEYLYLRRRSSCLVPVFCIFGITDSLFNVEELDENNVKFSLDFPEKMYAGFTDRSDYSCAFLQAKSFEDEIRKTFNNCGIKYIMQRSIYGIVDDEFYYEPTEERKELFLKRSIYSEQNELRIILPYEQLDSICERKNVQLNPCNKDDKFVLSGGLHGFSFIGKR